MPPYFQIHGENTSSKFSFRVVDISLHKFPFRKHIPAFYKSLIYVIKSPRERYLYL